MNFKRLLVFCTITAAGAAGLWSYWQYTARHPSTEDAYLNAHVVQVTPQITGEVLSVAVHDQQHVSRGDLLFELDRQSLITQREAAQAHLAQTHTDVDADSAAVEAAQADVHNREVLLKNAEASAQRIRRVVNSGGLSRQEGDNASANLDSARAQLALAQAQLHAAVVRRGEAGAANPRIQAIEADIRRIAIDLEHTTISAPCNGQVENISLRPGNVVMADRPVFALVCDDGFWVEANFKETQLEHLRPGQAAEIRFDMYPDRRFHGKVESISQASGVTFSLLPPENATGNWVKVTQRIPVRISLQDADPQLPMRIGSSARIRIDTTR